MSNKLLDSFKRVQPVHLPSPLPYDEKMYNLLLNEYRLVHLFYHRNKNQHRVARWWSYLDILHRHLRKLLLIMEDITEIITLRRLSIIRWDKSRKSFRKMNEIPAMKVRNSKNNKNSKASKKEKRKVFLHNQLPDDAAISLVNRKLSLLGKEVKYIYKQVIQSCYWQFMGIIELAQFINLGFTLVGITARVWDITGKFDIVKGQTHVKPKDIKDTATTLANTASTAVENQTQNQNEIDHDIGMKVDLGEAICVEQVEEHVQEIVSNPTQPSPLEKPKKTKNKSNKNFMDDLFGSGDSSESVASTKKPKEKEKKKKKSKKSKSAIDDIFGF